MRGSCSTEPPILHSKIHGSKIHGLNEPSYTHPNMGSKKDGSYMRTTTLTTMGPLTLCTPPLQLRVQSEMVDPSDPTTLS